MERPRVDRRAALPSTSVTPDTEGEIKDFNWLTAS